MITDQGSQSPFTIPAAWWRLAGRGVLVAAVLVVGYFLFEEYLRVAAVIILLAAMLTYLLQPAVEWLVRACRARHLHAARITAVLLLYVLLALLLSVFGAMITATFRDQVTALQVTWQSSQQHVPAQIQQFQLMYTERVPEAIRVQIQTTIQRELTQSPDKYLPGVVRWAMGIAKKAGKWLSLLVELIFVPLVAYYFLTESAKVRASMLFFVPKRYRASTLTYAGGMNTILRRYVHGQVVLGLIAWVVTTLGLLLLHVPGALLLGFIAGVSRGIPVLGPVIGGIPVLGAVLLTTQDPSVFWFVFFAFIALHLFEGKVLMPRILGDHLGLHPVLVIIGLIVGYEMMGLLGMFLAPPTLAMIRFVLALRRGDLSSDEAPADPPSQEAHTPA